MNFGPERLRKTAARLRWNKSTRGDSSIWTSSSDMGFAYIDEDRGGYRLTVDLLRGSKFTVKRPYRSPEEAIQAADDYYQIWQDEGDIIFTDHQWKRTSRKAALRDGPVGRVLEKHWNSVHDIEHALKETIHEYDVAASYSDGPARKDAEAMMKAIEKVHKMLEEISMKALGDLTKKEADFVRKHGEPDDYAAAQRDRIYPR